MARAITIGRFLKVSVYQHDRRMNTFVRLFFISAVTHLLLNCSNDLHVADFLNILKCVFSACAYKKSHYHNMIAWPHDGLSLQPDVSKRPHENQTGLASEVGANRCSDLSSNGKHTSDSI